jgi:hypothetical protein
VKADDKPDASAAAAVIEEDLFEDFPFGEGELSRFAWQRADIALIAHALTGPCCRSGGRGGDQGAEGAAAVGRGLGRLGDDRLCGALERGAQQSQANGRGQVAAPVRTCNQALALFAAPHARIFASSSKRVAPRVCWDVVAGMHLYTGYNHAREAPRRPARQLRRGRAGCGERAQPLCGVARAAREAQVAQVLELRQRPRHRLAHLLARRRGALARAQVAAKPAPAARASARLGASAEGACTIARRGRA